MSLRKPGILAIGVRLTFVEIPQAKFAKSTLAILGTARCHYKAENRTKFLYQIQVENFGAS
jgi:hypothetical protein